MAPHTPTLPGDSQSDMMCFCDGTKQAGCTSSVACQLINSSSRNNGAPKLWIFGYGSLIWKPVFEYSDCQIGTVNDYKRRFWQGNTYHRGTVDSPAAVATLVPAVGEQTWGVSFCVKGCKEIRAALDHVIGREITHGGYCVTSVQFHPYQTGEDCHRALVFYAEPSNNLYLRMTDIPSLAARITSSEGRCGNNVQYLFELVDAIRKFFPPQALDSHLQELETACRKILSESKKRKNSVELP